MNTTTLTSTIQLKNFEENEKDLRGDEARCEGNLVRQASGKYDAVYGVGGVGHTQRRLKPRHVALIGFGGGIGSGLFIETGSMLKNAGPAAIVFSLQCIIPNLGQFPTTGSFPHLATRFIDPALGFTLAISYGCSSTIAMVSEVNNISKVVLVTNTGLKSYWTDLNPALVISLSLLSVLAINLFSVRYYGEAEVVSAVVKGVGFLILVIVSLVITLGGAPNCDRIGFKYWIDPGPFAKYNDITKSKGQFFGIFRAFIDAIFSFIGMETVVVTASESVNPHRSITKAVKRVIYRILYFNVLGAFLLGLTLSSTDPNLIDDLGESMASPFIVAMKNAGVEVVPSIINVCILFSAWSSCSGYLYVTARMIIAMAVDRHIPQVFSKVSRWGVPYFAVMASFVLSLLSYICLADRSLTWLKDISTMTGLLAWMTLCICFIRYEQACRAQGINRNNLDFKSRFQPYSAYIGAIGCAVIILLSGIKVLSGKWTAVNFVTNYAGVIVYVVPFVARKLIRKSGFARSAKLDLFSGRFDSSSMNKTAAPLSCWDKFMGWLV
ncbi:amino acid permease [Blumeria hordei DH14]|uniref:Amino acid permease n=1 Tax=Blumeria graminis f. sp. hordei (strain DH14) TaxID=546991 RepID=N1JN98_BLUG1|nr:amino acid permease [Blumeria hordei DH14]